MITKTKNSTFAAIISLSLLMASMPIKAEDNTKTYTKKALRCTWHAAKVLTGTGFCILGTCGIIISLIAKSRLFNLIIAEEDYSQKEKAKIKKYAVIFFATAGCTFLIPGITSVKSGVSGLKKELGSSENQQPEEEQQVQYV